MSVVADKEKTEDLESSGSPTGRRRKSDVDAEKKWNDGFILFLCFAGLQGFYLTWGVLQEKIMTQEYAAGKYTSSTFLVFANRLAAILVGVALISWSKSRGDPQGNAPMYEYFFPAFSNVCSSFSAYEALKHVSFPLQVLTKASKLIPVMIMGRVVQRKRYETSEYVQAVVLTFGVALFFYSEQSGSKHTDNESTVFGFLLLLVYILADSFTSQYQDKINKTFHATEYEMMFGMNFFSIIVTFITLIVSGQMMPSLHFVLSDPVAMYDIVVLSLCACLGQLVIYFTLKRFGPIVFSLIMMIRQIFSLLMSCFLYGHPVGVLGYIGVTIVFGMIFYRWYAGTKR